MHPLTCWKYVLHKIMYICYKCFTLISGSVTILTVSLCLPQGTDESNRDVQNVRSAESNTRCLLVLQNIMVIEGSTLCL
ncbi:hypothetical protein KC19_2G285600 [Ceratodon purpureus]|uniref:Uncharacterized protein n=1 Tax=Ceratodon purpureus TaxID=3225 RepID=A0A8T0J2S0_CERPU|nr:hypothetical protein KC19_2G285600 [Ceratodon purpureus]